jgi:hypothetical protein
MLRGSNPARIAYEPEEESVELPSRTRGRSFHVALNGAGVGPSPTANVFCISSVIINDNATYSLVLFVILITYSEFARC